MECFNTQVVSWPMGGEQSAKIARGASSMEITRRGTRFLVVESIFS